MATAQLPPGPKGRLLSGHLPEFRRDRLGFLAMCAHEYGDIVSLSPGVEARHLAEPSSRH